MFAFFGLGMVEIILLAAVGTLILIPVVVVVMIRASGGHGRREEHLDEDSPGSRADRDRPD